jgi:DNA-binding response OmpR family regulator
MTVLVIEDDADAREALIRVLSQAGFVVSAVGDGLSALKRLRQEDFDAVICDLRLPGLPGGGIYDALKEERPELARRMIFVSGIAYDPAVKAFLESTGQPYFGKPYEAQELIAAVREIVRQS